MLDPIFSIAQNVYMLWSAVWFETFLLWMCCPWIAFVISLALSEQFRVCGISTYFFCLLTCMPTYLVYVILIIPFQSSLALEVPILLSVLVFLIIAKAFSNKDRSHSAWLKRDLFVAFALTMYVLCGITTLLSLAWMGL